MAARLASREISTKGKRFDADGNELVMTRVYEYHVKRNGALGLRKSWDWRIRKAVQ